MTQLGRMTSSTSGGRSALGARWWARAAWAVARRPSLWPTAVHQVFVLAAPGWWRRRPHLPVPDPAYVRFRLQTAYGDARHEPAAHDLVTYLRWCRSWPRVSG
jgi:hypothetical protein